MTYVVMVLFSVADLTKRTLSISISLELRHNKRDGVSNHQPNDCLFNLVFGRR